MLKDRFYCRVGDVVVFVGMVEFFVEVSVV